MSALQPLPTNFSPNLGGNIAQNHYVSAGVAATLPAGVIAWKSGYPGALSPYEYFIWYDETRNFKTNVLPETFNGPCVRVKTRWRVFAIDSSFEPPQAVDVTAQACDFNENLTNSGIALYSPEEFSVESISSVSEAVDFSVCDCELPAFFPDPELSYGHTDAVEVSQGNITLDFVD
jgi:hypothetical protein